MAELVRGSSRRLVIVAGVILLMVGVVWGLASAFAESSPPAASGEKLIMRVGWTNDPDNLNPFIGYESSSYEIWALNYDLLTGWRALDNTVQQGAEATGLATEWSYTPDGKTWTFKLRPGMKWQDGEPVTASDVAWTFNTIIDNELSAFTMYTTFIDNVEAVDDVTVQFNCSKPKANMDALWIPILPEHIWSKVKTSTLETTFANKPPIIGSGAFQCVEWKKGDYVRMEANKNYWRGAPKIDEVFFQTYTNTDSMAQELKAGGIDATWGILDAQYRMLQNDPTIKAIDYPTVGFDELGFNCYTGRSLGHPVLTDPKFRQSLQWAVDKQKIVDISYGGHAVPADTIINKDFYAPDRDWHWSVPADKAYSFDLEKAKAALEAAGYTDSDGNGIREYKGKDIELRLWSRSESQSSISMGKLMAGWFGDIGLKIELVAMDDGDMSDKMYNYAGDTFVPDFDMFLWGWGGDQDPTFILSIFLTDQIESWSDCNWSNAEFDELFDTQANQLDFTERKATIDRMQEIVYDESPYIPIAYIKDLEAYNVAKWQGWVQAPEGKGGVIYTTIIDSYLNLEPNTGEGSDSDSGSNTALIVGIVAAVVVAIVVIVVFTRRGKGSEAVEE